MRAAVSGWLWSIDGACLAWIEGELPLSAAELRDVLLGALGGALLAAGATLPAG